MQERELDPKCIFEQLLLQYLHGSMRINQAEIALHSSLAATASFKDLEEEKWSESRYAKVFCYLDNIANSNGSAFDYVGHVSILVYLTTLLDTFLVSTTEFMLLLNPGSIGGKQNVSFANVLNAKSIPEVITQSARDKAREVSYLPFLGRVAFLREKFGLNIDIDEATEEKLVHFSEVRNSAVHDQGFLRLYLSEDKQLAMELTKCPKHPTPITTDDLRTAERVYNRFVSAIGMAVLRDVLKEPGESRSFDLLSSLRVDLPKTS